MGPPVADITHEHDFEINLAYTTAPSFEKIGDDYKMVRLEFKKASDRNW